MQALKSDTRILLFFDGVCILCNGFVRQLLRWDRKKVFHFTALQNTLAKEYLPATLSEKNNFTTVVLMLDNQLYIKSAAVFKICQLLGFPFNLLLVFKIVPVSWRDRIYDYIASKRYAWFGKRSACYIPTPEERHRFLEG